MTLLMAAALLLSDTPHKKVYVTPADTKTGVIVTGPAPLIPFGLIVPYENDRSKNLAGLLGKYCKDQVEISGTPAEAEFVLTLRMTKKGADLRTEDAGIVFSSDAGNEAAIAHQTCKYLRAHP